MITPFLLACVLQAADAPPAPPGDPPKASGRELKVVARGAWPHLPTHTATAPRRQQQWAFRSERELAMVVGEHALPAVARALKVEKLDFKRQMLLAVADGTLPLVGVSGGGPPSAPHRIEVSRVERDDTGKALTVYWRLARPDPAAGPITYPLAAALVGRFDGEARFVRLPNAGGEGPGKDKGAAAPAGKEVKVLARAFWPDGWKAAAPPRQWVVRSYQELVDPRMKAPEPVLERIRKQNAEQYARALGVAAIDFKKLMIVGVSAGTQPTGGYRVEVGKVEAGLGGAGLTVFWRLHAPRAGRPVTEALAHPAEVVLVEQSPGPVRSHRLRESGGRRNDPAEPSLAGAQGRSLIDLGRGSWK